jgi:hypothetical protein
MIINSETSVLCSTTSKTCSDFSSNPSFSVIRRYLGPIMSDYEDCAIVPSCVEAVQSSRRTLFSSSHPEDGCCNAEAPDAVKPRKPKLYIP